MPVVVMVIRSAYQVLSPCVLPLASLRSEEVNFKKIACMRLFVVVRTKWKTQCVPSFISMRGTVSEFEEWRSKIKFLMLFVVVVIMEKRCNTHAYHVSPPYVLQLASLRSEEVFLKKSAWGYLLLWSWWKRCNTHAHQVSPPCVWGVKK